MASDHFERRGRRSGFTPIPHEFWTLRLSNDERANCSALLMLGWLHSHQDEYLSRLSVREIAKQIGWTPRRVTQSLGVLSDGGWIDTTIVSDQTTAVRTTIVLDETRFADWLADAVGSRGRGVTTTSRRGADTAPPVVPLPHHGRDAATASPSIENDQLLENQGEHQTTDTTIVLPIELPAHTFDEFWKLYPRKVSKPAAGTNWRSLVTGRDKIRGEAIIAGLRPWLAYWAARNEPEFIPHPSTWLKQRRFDDQPPALRTTRGKAVVVDVDRGGDEGQVVNW